MPESRLLVIVRHGRTDWNARGLFQGHADPPLDACGELQAAIVATRVTADLAEAGKTPALILSSDLRRAAATAWCIAARMGTEVTTDPSLREVDLGGWEGLDRRQAQDRFPAQYRYGQRGVDVRRGGGETRAEAGRRVADRIESELARTGKSEVRSSDIGARVLEALRALDPVAYVRFASVYQSFSDIRQFLETISELPGGVEAGPETDRPAEPEDPPPGSGGAGEAENP